MQRRKPPVTLTRNKAAIENTATSWKDEFGLVVLIAPAMAVYIWPEEIQVKFTVLAALPEW